MTTRKHVERYRNRPMSRGRAYDVAIAFGIATGLPLQPVYVPEHDGWNAVVPMEYVEGLLESIRVLQPRDA